MKVVHVSRFDGGTGAAIAASRLHKGLLQLGIESMMFVAESRGMVTDATVKLFQPSRDLHSRLRRRIRSERITRSLAISPPALLATRLSAMTGAPTAPTCCLNSLLVT